MKERERNLYQEKKYTHCGVRKKRYIHCSVEYEVSVSVCEGSKKGRKKKLLFIW